MVDTGRMMMRRRAGAQGHFAIKGGDATKGGLTVYYDGARPRFPSTERWPNSTDAPMRKQGVAGHPTRPYPTASQTARLCSRFILRMLPNPQEVLSLGLAATTATRRWDPFTKVSLRVFSAGNRHFAVMITLCLMVAPVCSGGGLLSRCDDSWLLLGLDGCGGASQHRGRRLRQVPVDGGTKCKDATRRQYTELLLRRSVYTSMQV